MKYGFIGCGNMGSAIAKALSKTTTSIIISDPSPAAAAFTEEYGFEQGTNIDVLNTCERVFLGVKPQMLESVLAPLRLHICREQPIIISMAAGVQISKLEELADCQLPIIRIMPNTPVAVGKGMVTYCTNELVSPEIIESFKKDMQFAGRLDAITESLIDAASAVAGCGPAFMYMYLEALADGAVACGLPRAKAIEYAAMTMAGAAEMVLQGKDHPEKLKDDVCSPGGSTIIGVKALEAHALRSAAIQAVIDAYRRTVELGT
ncbi:MAG: pyrroline-5-carboxylate reductase [Ruminococcaceae bacterium]|nr:pyrroline-5-carboxylate reductase [Oscillospiraceae bacterium]